MENRKSKIESIIKNILIFIFIFIICFSNIFVNQIGNLDEIWNYNSARNIANELVPYKDVSMVSVPLLFIICGLFLNIFGNQLIVMRILAVILMSLIFFMIYKILKLITKEEIAILLVVLFTYIFREIMCIDYNYAVLLIALILTYIELKKSKEEIFNYDFKYNFIIGIIAGISILLKQTTGIALTVACIGYKIFAIRKKEDLKNFFKIVLIRFLGALIPLIVFVLYLILSGALNSFIDYTILGLKNFSNKIAYVDLLQKDRIMPILVPLVIFFMFVMQFMKKINNDINVLFAYSIATFIVVFPISDKIHFWIGSLITCISFIYLIYECILRKIKFNKKTKIVIYALLNFLVMLLILLSLYNSIIKINNEYVKVEKETKLEHFIGIPENKGLNERIFEIDEYILQMNSEGKNVYILDAEAAIYNIPLNLYHKDYDMFLKGNLGSNSEEKIISRIQNEENCVYLIKKSGLNWQNPNEVREYIIKNLNYVGDISIFYIYEK